MKRGELPGQIPSIWIQNLDVSHPGVSKAMSDVLCEAATVCLDRHHQSPIHFSIQCLGEVGSVAFHWVPASPRALASHRYENDATKDGAYAISLISIEHHLNLVAVGQAESGTGADWYLQPIETAEIDEAGFPNLDAPNSYRLEVSGKNIGAIGYRTNVKRQQLSAGYSNLPGIATVVGFERATVKIDHPNANGGEA